MNKQQFLLLKLAEECMEVAQRASKHIQFGPNEIQKDQSLTNSQRLKNELLDLYAVVGLLLDEGEPLSFTPKEYKQGKKAKLEKLNKYLKHSHSLGLLTEIENI